MIGRFGSKYFIALAVTAAALASGSSARADDDEGDDQDQAHHGKKGGPEEAAEGPPEAGHGEEGEGHGAGKGEHGKPHGKGHEEHVGMIGLDFVLGFGKVPVAVQNPPTNVGTLPTYSRGDSQVSSQSFVLGAAFHAFKHISLGIRIPFTFGELNVPNNSTRGTGALGNIELEGEYERHLNHNMALFFVLGISLPTAQGDEIPEDLADRTNAQVDQGAYDKAALQRAAAFSRGGEDNALFEPHRFGINPKIGVIYHTGKLTITPYVKVENLIGTSSSLAHSYLGELVPVVRAGYRIGHIEPALKLMLPIAFAGSDEDKKVGFVVEPQLAAHYGNVHPTLGVIIPVAGPAADPQFIGVRLAVAASF
jgi:hypothetical protein